MLTIRAEQMEILSQFMVRQFETRMIAHLRHRFAEHVGEMDDAGLCAFVRGGVEAAKGYGVTKRSDVKRYLEYMAQYGENFGKSPATEWAGSILRKDGLTGSKKMEQIDSSQLFAAR